MQSNQGSRGVLLAILLAMAAAALLPASPLLNRTPNNDYSIFLYVGREMVRGEMLYRDVYDHKPPLIFLINAAGVLLGGGGRWGVWALELVSLSIALVLAFLTLERFFGRLPAMAALAAMLVNLAFVHERGNLTEEYAYPFQFGALFLLAGTGGLPTSLRGARTERRLAGRFFAVGVLLGLASSLKQTMAGIGAAVVVYLVFEYLGGKPASENTLCSRSCRELVRILLWMAAGVAVVWLVWVVFFAAAGILPEFWEAAFLLNFSHSSHSTPERLQTLFEAFRWLIESSGFFLGGLLIWLTVLPFLALHDGRVLPALSGRFAGAAITGSGLLLLYNGLFRSGLVLYAFSELSPYRFGLLAFGIVLTGLGILFLTGWARGRIRRRLAPQAAEGRSELALPLIIALVDLPIALGLAILTGNNFPHYFMPLFPSLVILFAYGVHQLMQTSAPPARAGMTYVWLAVLMLPVFVPGVRMTIQQLHPRGDRQVEETAAYLKANTHADDPVLQWGIMSSVYILSNRSAPARYFTTNPLFFDGYSGEWQTSRMLDDLRARPPVLIIDTMMTRLPLVTAPEAPDSSGWQDCWRVKDPAYYQAFLEARRSPGEKIPQFTAGIGDIYQWICQNYRPAGSVGELNWRIYRLKGN